jgi:hypothetical protein
MAVPMNKGKVCAIDRHQLAELEQSLDTSGKVGCDDLERLGIRHHHFSRREADELNELLCVRMTRDQDGKEHFQQEREAAYIGKGRRVIVFERSRCWRPALSGGAYVMQLCYGGSAL